MTTAPNPEAMPESNPESIPVQIPRSDFCPGEGASAPSYQVYPGYDPPSFLRDFMQTKQITLMAFCKNERISPADFRRMAQEIMTEWELTEATHRDRKDAITHLINHIRIKHRNEQRNNATRQYGYAPGTDSDPDARMARIAQEIIRQSAGSNQP